MKQARKRSVLGGWIREKRRGRGWTQAELALKCGLDDNGAVNAWENRKSSRPSDENLIGLADAFGVSWTFLKCLQEKDRAPAVTRRLQTEVSVPEFMETADADLLEGTDIVLIIQLFKPLTQEQRLRLLGYLEAKAEEMKSN